MHSIFSYIVVAGIGLLIAHLLSRPPELHALRLSQLILVPAATVVGFYFLPVSGGRATLGDLGSFISYVGIMGFLALLLAPNIGYHFGMALSNFIDPLDWTPLEEEIALRPIQRMIDRSQYQEALAELDVLLKKHKPSHEALLLKTKLLHHFGSVDETVATLLKMIPLSNSTAQQLEVMEALATLESQHQCPPKPLAREIRQIRIHHELVLFPVETGLTDRSTHKEIPAGNYEVEETFNGNHRWLKLAGQDWGNAEMCWEAIQETNLVTPGHSANKVLAQIARMHQALSNTMSGKPAFHKQTQARKLLTEANPFIRLEQWDKALPLLQKASGCDPHCYEIAYRLVQAARRAGNKATTDRILREVLNQSRWTEDEQFMLLHD